MIHCVHSQGIHAPGRRSVAGISANWQAAKNVNLNFYYGCAKGKTVVIAIYPSNPNAQFG